MSAQRSLLYVCVCEGIQTCKLYSYPIIVITMSLPPKRGKLRNAIVNESFIEVMKKKLQCTHGEIQEEDMVNLEEINDKRRGLDGWRSDRC